MCKASVVVAVLVAVAGIGADPARKVGVRGAVTKVTKPSDDQKKAGTVLILMVEGKKEMDTMYDKGWITITDKTKIEKKGDKKNEAAKAEDLKEGCKVEVVFDGGVGKSMPIQAKALEIVIIEDKKK